AFRKMEVIVADVARAEVPAGGVTRFDAVPASEISVTLNADQWHFMKQIDLRDGSDGNVVFNLQPIVVRGTLFLGDEPTPGMLVFELGNKTMQTVDVAADGSYETVVWRPSGYVVHVQPRGDALAFIEPFIDIERDRRLDFHVPKNRVTVRVTDSRSGLAVPHARVNTESVSND